MVLSVGAVAQEAPVAPKPVRRIKIKHADPALIMMLLKAQQAKQPEISTIENTKKG